MLSSFPNELLLALFREFHLTTLIVGQGVCRNWRRLLTVTETHPMRRRLLKIYFQIITEPWFIESRPWVLENLVEFDREAYVEAILDQHSYLPAAFEIWLREWPAKAVFGGIWPGLPDRISDQVGPRGIGRRGWNYLDWRNPVVRTIKHINNADLDLDVDAIEEIVEPLPGIPIWHDPGSHAVWMLLDKGGYRDQVLEIIHFDELIASLGYDEPLGGKMGWIDYLERVLMRLRSIYARVGDVWGATRQHQYPDKFKRTYAPWKGQVPYLRPLRVL